MVKLREGHLRSVLINKQHVDPLYIIFVSFAFVQQIVPCNSKAEFNELTGDDVHFVAHGGFYHVDVTKTQMNTRLNGVGWDAFVSANCPTGRGQMVHFSITLRQPTMSAIWMGNMVDEDDEDEGEDAKIDVDEGAEDPFQSTIFALRINLGDNEKARLLQLLTPIGTYIGVPFVTCFTATNINTTNVMVCF